MPIAELRQPRGAFSLIVAITPEGLQTGPQSSGMSLSVGMEKATLKRERVGLLRRKVCPRCPVGLTEVSGVPPRPTSRLLTAGRHQTSKSPLHIARVQGKSRSVWPLLTGSYRFYD